MPGRKRITFAALYEANEDIRHDYDSRCAFIQVVLSKCKYGTQSILARELDSDPTWISQVINRKKISYVTLMLIERWVWEHADEYAKDPPPAA